MTTHDTRSQLLAEIAASPDDDTLRLAFADWLDEHGDPADADRAEFIRVQCELAPLNDLADSVHPMAMLGSDGIKREALLARSYQLLSAHPEWSRCRCPECDGSGDQGKKNGHDGLACPACGGTGDLFLTPRVSGASLTPPPKPRTVTFARGFVDGVTCTLAEAFAPDGTPTPWAVEVVKQTPVVRFRMTDQTPHHRDAAIRGPFAVGLVWDWSSASTPEFLMDEMAAAHPDKFADTPGGDVWWMEFETESEARDALALAAGRLVRRHAHKERT